MRTHTFIRAFVTIASIVVSTSIAFAEAAGRAIVHHVPPAETAGGEALRLVADVDDAWTEKRLVARYRRSGSVKNTPYAEINFERSSIGGYYATIPAGDVKRPGVEYFIVGVLGDGAEVTHFASANWPHEVRVEPRATLRWIEAENERIGGRTAQIRAHMEGVRFGDSDGTDHYLRGEVSWTSRLVTTLYSFTLGYGFVEGKTPVQRDSDDDDPSVGHDARYGFAEVRLRVHPSVWIDGGVGMGFSHDGFSGLVRGMIVLGKDWRSCVQIGAEYIEDLDAAVWLRLQWDTVPPFLMGVTVKDTSFPGSNIGRGSLIAYDLTYPITQRIAITASISYASRSERPGAIGGGLATSFEF